MVPRGRQNLVRLRCSVRSGIFLRHAAVSSMAITGLQKNSWGRGIEKLNLTKILWGGIACIEKDKIWFQHICL